MGSYFCIRSGSPPDRVILKNELILQWESRMSHNLLTIFTFRFFGEGSAHQVPLVGILLGVGSDRLWLNKLITILDISKY